jgi:hypothetical protein
MKKVFIVLLIAAIGAGVYFYFSRKPKTSTSNSKELIVGNWRVDSIQVPHDDTIFDFEKIGLSSKAIFKFDTTGLVVRQQFDSTIADTSFYRFVANDQIVWTHMPKDSVTKPMRIVKLNAGKLTLQSNDNGRAVLTKID